MLRFAGTWQLRVAVVHPSDQRFGCDTPGANSERYFGKVPMIFLTIEPDHDPVVSATGYASWRLWHATMQEEVAL